jgi:two-component system LytT family response regulator
MSKIRAILVDDEPLAIRLLAEILSHHNDIEVISQCSSSVDAIKQIQKLQPDLVLLDIQMPTHDGFDVVREIQSDVMPVVVFVTAYDQYAVEAFNVFALDYLLKPVDPERLAATLMQVRERIRAKHMSDKARVLDVTAERQQQVQVSSETEEAVSASLQDRLAIRDGVNTDLVPFEDIDWIDAAGDYMCVHAVGKTYVMRCTMKELQQRLSSGPFARIHRSTLVNLNKVQSMEALPRGESLLLLPDDVRLKVSRNFRQEIQALHG